MKHVGSLFSNMAAYGVALLVAYSVADTQAQQQPGKAVVRAIRGTAQYSQGADWMPLAVGTQLNSGAVIKTGAGSQVDLFLDQNGPVVRVTAETVLALDKLTFEDTGASEAVIETKLNLTNGRILGSVKKMAAASKYEVKIPTGTVGIRGTEYDISANGVVTINKGEAEVFYVLGATTSSMTVKAGQTFMPPTTAGGQPTVMRSTPDILRYDREQFIEINLIVGPDITTPPIGPTKPTEIPPTEPPISPTTGESGSSSQSSDSNHPY